MRISLVPRPHPPTLLGVCGLGTRLYAHVTTFVPTYTCGWLNCTGFRLYTFYTRTNKFVIAVAECILFCAIHLCMYVTEILILKSEIQNLKSEFV